MIPLTLARQVQATLLDYVATTFNFQDPAIEEALLAFLTGQDEPPDGPAPHPGMFQGPYLHLRLPFSKILPEELPPLEIVPPFRPYVHQMRSFERLTSRYGHAPQPTVITTGTGSGKTECFLYPILDHCYARRDEPGIKAILLYPMNALASDQAARLADILWNDERLRGQVRAGIYVGGKSAQTHTTPGPAHLVDDRDALRQDPPDILLTNYKMLDFLLLRPEDRPLWTRNGPHSLRYLVLDELHTYDGAQGSDVACLIRRLKARLAIPPGVLCPVGTSATVVSDAGDTVAALTRFAQEIFAVPFGPEAVIGEERQSLREFFDGYKIVHSDLPADEAGLRAQAGEPVDEYVGRQMRLWFGEELASVDDAQGRALALADALR
ncbi:MAG: DEAD/DEAH box helicase, partial [Delftia sp.]|nr:DEAD/DEAH box helicase [Delftia sp.]